MKPVIIFLTLLIFFGCSAKKSETEIFDEAQKNLKEQKFPEAALAFEEIVNAYPDSKLAPEALSQLASIYQNKQIKNLSEKQNLEKAVELFKKLHNDYPTSEFAPPGLFMAGFISANELQNYEAATAIYKQFLSEYPDNELTESAKAELNNMGLTPEEILLKQMAKDN